MGDRLPSPSGAVAGVHLAPDLPLSQETLALMDALRGLGLPPEQRAAIRRAAHRGIAVLQAQTPQRLSEWMREHFKLDEDSSHVSGDFIPFPFQIGLLDWMGDDRIPELTIPKAKRVGYTKGLVGFAAYCAAHRRRKVALWQPTDDDRDSFIKSEIEPAFAACKAVRDVADARKEKQQRIQGSRSGNTRETMAFRRFAGSVQHYLGAKAARAFRRITVDAAVGDEVDGMDQLVEKSGDPIDLMRGRLEGAAFPKQIIGSTPRNKGMSHVERKALRAEARMRYHVACPHCGRMHPLLWGGKGQPHGFKWLPGQPETAHHVCPHDGCGGLMRQADYAAAAPAGRWVSDCGLWRYDHHSGQWLDAQDRPCRPPRRLAVALGGLWSAYSPQVTWAEIARSCMDAAAAKKAGNTGPMMVFVNETLGDVWEEAFEATDADRLFARAEAYPLRIVPAGACKLVAAVDTQADRWEMTVWAVGRREEMWAIDHQVVYGNPTDPREWEAKVGALRDRRYPHRWGQTLSIDALGVDTGGSNWTHQAYAWVRSCNLRNGLRTQVFALKGDPALGMPIKMKPTWLDVNERGRIVKRGIKLWKVCVDTAKDTLHERLKLSQHGPGFLHLSQHLPRAWFDEMAAEQRMPQRTATGVVYRWLCPSGRRNEAWDCAVYALFLVAALGLDSATEAMWDRWESALAPDLFSAPPDADGVIEPAMPQPAAEHAVPGADRPGRQQPAAAAPPGPEPAAAPAKPPPPRVLPPAAQRAAPRLKGVEGVPDDWSIR